MSPGTTDVPLLCHQFSPDKLTKARIRSHYLKGEAGTISQKMSIGQNVRCKHGQSGRASVRGPKGNQWGRRRFEEMKQFRGEEKSWKFLDLSQCSMN